ncbi:MAG: Efflux RND transporter periplasmic adaptor subunit [Magnetococcales bacterium]|nr:Efflux RND transporter periplasmic adaptor subunit [Magnetococcales bacterium]HIJ85991.1 efflux RND transporter periplasmic adaptor subunit [Magnetococcales bacterium]
MEISLFRSHFFALVILFGSFLASCSKGEEAGKKKMDNPSTPVTTVAVVQKNIPLIIHAVGNAESCRTVAIKAQVDGEITRAYVTDGQEVREKDPLFDLDDRRYRHRLAQLRANLDKDLAQLEQAHSKERRQTLLNKEKIASEENLASMVANRKMAEASVAADRAAIAEGELQLGFTRISAPIAGMTGRILMQPGNVVKANDTAPLVVINQMDPMCISFSVAEHHLASIRDNHAQAPLTLQVTSDREGIAPVPATLLSIDNAIDRQTASIRLKAQADNGKRRLWPGLFVSVELKLFDRPNALVIPAQAVQTGTKGIFVYVVKPDATVEQRSITLAQESKEEAVIDTGLNLGEMVVTVGQWRLKPGAKVETAKSKETDPEKKGQGDKK